jgi:hypothetical protein
MWQSTSTSFNAPKQLAVTATLLLLAFIAVDLPRQQTRPRHCLPTQDSNKLNQHASLHIPVMASCLYTQGTCWQF